MTYNTSLIQNLTRPDQIVTGVNTMSGGLYGMLMFAAIYILCIKLWTSRGVAPLPAFIYSSFVAEIVAIIFWALGILAWEWAFLPLVLLFSSFVISKWVN